MAANQLALPPGVKDKHDMNALLLLIGAACGDLISTIYGLSIGLAEDNVVASFFYSQLGIVGLAVPHTIGILLILYISNHIPYRRAFVVISSVYSIYTLIIILNNLFFISSVLIPSVHPP
jgi:hypothetical protein